MSLFNDVLMVLENPVWNAVVEEGLIIIHDCSCVSSDQEKSTLEAFSSLSVCETFLLVHV